MKQYQNTFMGIEVNFPDTWNFRYWGNRPDKSSVPKTHQSNFEDLPCEVNPEKVLVTSISRHTSGSIILRSIFEIVALYRPTGIDLQSEIPIDASEISRRFGTDEVAANHARFMHIEKQGEGFIRYMRCYYWQVHPEIWLACIVSGSSLEQFNEALSILGFVRRI
jgi:hypothetical protein